MKGVDRTYLNAAVLTVVLVLAGGCLKEETPELSAAASDEPAGSNSSPSISGNPLAEVLAENAYLFTPTASDPDGDALSFSIANRPAWASFNQSNGELTGTPRSADVGSYSNIVITVTDGSASVSLGAFTILVVDSANGSVTLSWTAPTQNEDGSELIDLSGYKIYWGTTPGNYTKSVTIDNESVTTYVVENLPAGTYEFVATSYNSAGMESRFSDPATMLVN